MEMHRKRYFPADLEPFPLHYAALRGNTDQVRTLLATTGCNPYQPIQDGETALHVAIVEGQLEVADLLIEKFRNDFQTIGKYLVEKFQCDPEDEFWLGSSILVAVDENQHQMVEELERFRAEHPKESILVLLKNPIGNDRIAVLNPNQIDQLELLGLIKTLLPNGFLSWNSTGPAGKCDSLLHSAAHYGHVKLVEQLAESGANLAVAGPGGQTAFHAACEASQNQVIELLLTKYPDRFDPSALDDTFQHGIHYVLKRKNQTIFQLVVRKTVEHRVHNFNETPSEAFNAVFKLEIPNCKHKGIWPQLDGRFWNDLIEIELERYQYNLTYKWEEVVVLIEMMTYRHAMKYCIQEIRKNLELLKVSTSYGFTGLHAVICANELDLVKEIYDTHDFDSVFEDQGAYSTVHVLMEMGFLDMLKLVLNRHENFLLNNLSIVEDIVMSYEAPNYEEMFAVLLQHFPQLKSSISKGKAMMEEFSYEATEEFDNVYAELLQNFTTTVEKITNSGKILDCFCSPHRGSFLLRAVSDNQLELVKQFLNTRSINLDFLNSDGRHAIHYVKNKEMLRLLVESYTEGSTLVNRKDHNGFTLLHCISPNNVPGREALILELLRLGIKLDERTNDLATVLFHTNDEELYRFFTEDVRSGGFLPVDPGLRDSEGNTALHRQLRDMNSHISSVMLRSASSFISFNNVGDSYLCYMTKFERQTFDASLKPILEANPEKTQAMFEAEFRQSREKTSKLFLAACREMNVFLMEHFLQLDLDFNVRDEIFGMTALLELFSSDKIPDSKFILQLLEKNVDVTLSNGHGQNALILLGKNFSKLKSKGLDSQLVQILIDRGAKVNEVDHQGESVLHHAFRTSDLNLIIVLLCNNVDTALLNSSAQKPYQVASFCMSQILSFIQ